MEASFLAKGSPAASHVLHEVHKLQNKNSIGAYLFNLGLEDQNPEDWNDHEVRTDLVVPDPSDPSSDEGADSREGEAGTIFFQKKKSENTKVFTEMTL